MSYFRLSLAVAAISVFLTSEPVQAGPLDVEADISAVNDYRFRGLSLSDHRLALQANVTVSHGSGVYGNVFASTIDEYGQNLNGKGATVELDYSIGWTFETAGMDFDVSAAAYTYPGGHDVDYVELPMQVSRGFGSWTGLAGLAYSPEQHALDRDNRYVWLGLDHDGAGLPVVVSTRLGKEDGAFASDKIDWSLTASRQLGSVQASAGYVDSDQSGAALVVSLGLKF